MAMPVIRRNPPNLRRERVFQSNSRIRLEENLGEVRRREFSAGE